MTTSIIVYTTIGATVADSSELAYTTPLLIKRQGIEHDIIYTGTPGDRQVKFTKATGEMEFKVPFEAAPADVLIRNAGEPIFIMYKV